MFGKSNFFHNRLHQFFCVNKLLVDHAQVHCRHLRISLAGAIHAVLPHKHQGIGDAVKRYCQASALPSKHLFEMFQLFPVLEQVSKEKGIQVLLSAADAGVVWAEAGLDLTLDTVRKLDALAAAAKPAAPAAAAPKPAAPTPAAPKP